MTIENLFEFKGETQVLSFSAMSTSSLLSNQQTADLLSYEPTIQLSQSLNVSQMDQKSLLNPIVPYLEMAERFIKMEEGFNVIETVSELDLYQYKTIFETTSLTNTTINYQMHYNMIDTSEDEDEQSYEVDGVLFYGNKTYQIKGSKKQRMMNKS